MLSGEIVPGSLARVKMSLETLTKVCLPENMKYQRSVADKEQRENEFYQQAPCLQIQEIFLESYKILLKRGREGEMLSRNFRN